MMRWSGRWDATCLLFLCDPDEEGWGPEVTSAVVRMAETEDDADVLWSVAQALGFAEDPTRGGRSCCSRS